MTRGVLQVRCVARARQLERDGAGAVPEPELVGVHHVPGARVAGRQQEVDERGQRARGGAVLAEVGGGGVACGHGGRLPRAAVPAALGVRREAERGYQALRVGAELGGRAVCGVAVSSRCGHMRAFPR